MVVSIEVAHILQRLGAGALGLDVTGLLALVADFLAGARVLGAVAGEVTSLAAVVALGSVHTVTCYYVRECEIEQLVDQYLRDMWPTPPQL